MHPIENFNTSSFLISKVLPSSESSLIHSSDSRLIHDFENIGKNLKKIKLLNLINFFIDKLEKALACYHTSKEKITVDQVKNIGGSDYNFYFKVSEKINTEAIPLGYLRIRALNNGDEFSIHLSHDRIVINSFEVRDFLAVNYYFQEEWFLKENDNYENIVSMLRNLLLSISHHQDAYHPMWLLGNTHGRLEKIIDRGFEKNVHITKDYLTSFKAISPASHKLTEVNFTSEVHQDYIIRYESLLTNDNQTSDLNQQERFFRSSPIHGIVIESTDEMNLIYEYESGFRSKNFGHYVENKLTGERFFSPESIQFKSGLGSHFARTSTNKPYLLNKGTQLSQPDQNSSNVQRIKKAFDYPNIRATFLKIGEILSTSFGFSANSCSDQFIHAALIFKKFHPQFLSKTQIQLFKDALTCWSHTETKENFILMHPYYHTEKNGKYLSRDRRVDSYIVRELIAIEKPEDPGTLVNIHAKLTSTDHGYFNYHIFFDCFRDGMASNGPCIEFNAQKAIVSLYIYKNGKIDGNYLQIRISDYVHGPNKNVNILDIKNNLLSLLLFVQAYGLISGYESPPFEIMDNYYIIKKFDNGVPNSHQETRNGRLTTKGSLHKFGLEEFWDDEVSIADYNYASKVNYSDNFLHGRCIQSAITEKGKAEFYKIHPELVSFSYNFYQGEPRKGASLIGKDGKEILNVHNFSPVINPEKNVTLLYQAYTQQLKKVDIPKHIQKNVTPITEADQPTYKESKKNLGENILKKIINSIGCEINFTENKNARELIIEGTENSTLLISLYKQIKDLLKARKSPLIVEWQNLKHRRFRLIIKGPAKNLQDFLISPSTLQLINQMDEKYKNECLQENKITESSSKTDKNVSSSPANKIELDELIKIFERLGVGAKSHVEGDIITLTYKKIESNHPSEREARIAIQFEKHKSKKNKMISFGIPKDEFDIKVLSRIKKFTNLDCVEQLDSHEQISFVLKKKLSFSTENYLKVLLEIQEDLLKRYKIEKCESSVPSQLNVKLQPAIMKAESKAANVLTYPDLNDWLEKMNFKVNFGDKVEIEKTINKTVYRMTLSRANSTSIYNQALSLTDFFLILSEEMKKITPDCLNVHLTNGNLTVVVKNTFFQQFLDNVPADWEELFKIKIEQNILSLTKQTTYEIREYKKESDNQPSNNKNATIEDYPLIVLSPNSYEYYHLERLKDILTDLKTNGAADYNLIYAAHLHVTCFVHLLMRHIRECTHEVEHKTLFLWLRNAVRHKKIPSDQLIEILDFLVKCDYTHLLGKQSFANFNKKINELVTSFNSYENFSKNEFENFLKIEKAQLMEYYIKFVKHSLTPIEKEAAIMIAARIGKLLKLAMEKNIALHLDSLDEKCLEVRRKVGHPDSYFYTSSEAMIKLLFDENQLISVPSYTRDCGYSLPDAAT